MLDDKRRIGTVVDDDRRWKSGGGRCRRAPASCRRGILRQGPMLTARPRPPRAPRPIGGVAGSETRFPAGAAASPRPPAGSGAGVGGLLCDQYGSEDEGGCENRRRCESSAEAPRQLYADGSVRGHRRFTRTSGGRLGRWFTALMLIRANQYNHTYGETDLRCGITGFSSAPSSTPVSEAPPCRNWSRPCSIRCRQTAKRQGPFLQSCPGSAYL